MHSPIRNLTSKPLTKLKPPSSPLLCSSRFFLAIVGFFGFANLYALRVNLSVAMVCMVNYTAIAEISAENESLKLEYSPNTTSLADMGDCSSKMPVASSKIKKDGDFVWMKDQQGMILGAFFWGYMITQIPGGMIAEKWGGKSVFLWSMFAAAIATLLCPVAARLHVGLLMALRILIGLGEGVVFPAMHSIWSKWSPPAERSILTGFTYAGAQIGNVVTFPFSAFLCDAAGWESIFYVFGSLGLLWCLAWFLIASNSPTEHKRISEQELSHIVGSLRGQVDQNRDSKQALNIPWMKFLKSGPVWAIVVTHTCANFGTYLVLTNLPTFFKEVLKFDIKSNGAISAIPYLAFFAAINAAGWTADTLRKRKILSTTWVRKILMLFSLCGQAAFLIATGYCRCGQETQAVIFITLAQGISGFQYGGFIVNHVDIAPRYAGTLFGVSNTLATVSGIAAPSVAAALTGQQSREEWRLVFLVAAVILVFGAVFYTALGSGELQPWAVPDKPAGVELVPTSKTEADALLKEDHSPVVATEDKNKENIL